MAVLSIFAFIRCLLVVAATAPNKQLRFGSDTANDGSDPLYNQDPLLVSNDLSMLIVDNITSQANMGKSHFRTATKFQTDYSPSNITKYESQRTGMTAVVVDREGPKVHGFFALATEILDDSGAPHTLEHLCFMGSRSYPYKGILDRLATRYVRQWR
jgi:hypothetical protein